jgi:DNA-binding transcriptional LysR family regulator
MKTKLMFISREDFGEEVSLREVANHPIILPEQGSVTRDYLMKEFHKRNLTMTNPIDCQNPPAIRHMVELGMGGAFFPLFSIQKDVQEGLFHAASVTEDLYMDYDLIFLKDRRSSNIVRIFTSTMKKLQRSLSK